MNKVRFVSSEAFQNQKKLLSGSATSVVEGAFSSYRKIVECPKSEWSCDIEERLTELTSLPVGWDGYAGLPVSFQTAYFVANMLSSLYQEGVPAPFLVPGSDGSVQIEWHRNFFDVELDVLGQQNVVASRIDHRNDEDETILVKNDFTKISEWIGALAEQIHDSDSTAVGC